MEQLNCLICQHTVNCIPCATASKAQAQKVVQKEVLIGRINAVPAVQKHVMRRYLVVLHHQCGSTATKKGKLNSVQGGAFLV